MSICQGQPDVGQADQGPTHVGEDVGDGDDHGDLEDDGEESQYSVDFIMHALPLVHLLKRPDDLAEVLLLSSKLWKVDGASVTTL
eukprot:3598984-Pyramimonas_sp.AAC.1